MAFSAEVLGENLSFHLIFNAHWEPLELELPAERHVASQPWRRWMDTSLESPTTFRICPSAPVVTGQTYLTGPRSVVVLIAAADGTTRGLLAWEDSPADWLVAALQFLPILGGRLAEEFLEDPVEMSEGLKPNLVSYFAHA